MKLSDLTHRAGEWLRGVGPMHDVVISSRVRYARNLAGMPFLSRCTGEQLRELETRLRDTVLEARLADEMLYVDVAAAGKLDRELVVERHLISRQHADGRHPRGVAISGSETVAVMVNEEDHLRIQVLRSGLQLSEAFEDLSRIDELLEERASFAFHDRYGYLTACPTNVGTGIRCSVMVHLPALVISRRIEKVLGAVTQIGLTVRGLSGEGSEIAGNLFQISNQWTLGISEPETITKIEKILQQILEQERRAQDQLLEENRRSIEDRVWRAYATLRYAQVMSSNEAIELLSSIRLGLSVGILNTPSYESINAMIISVRPAHLQKLAGRPLTPPERDEWRAELVRNWIQNGDSVIT